MAGFAVGMAMAVVNLFLMAADGADPVKIGSFIVCVICAVCSLALEMRR